MEKDLNFAYKNVYEPCNNKVILVSQLSLTVHLRLKLWLSIHQIRGDLLSEAQCLVLCINVYVMVLSRAEF